MSSLFSSAPKPPDPAQVAAAQTASNLATAQNQAKLNAVDQYNPYGSTTYLRDANGDPYGQVSNLSPELQWLLQGREATAGGLTGIAGDIMNQLQTGGFNAPGVNEVGNNVFNQYKDWLTPQFDRQTSNLQTTLTNRGVPVGSEAWNNAMQPLQQNQNYAWDAALNQAQQAGAAEQNTLFNQAMQQYNNPYNNLGQILTDNPSAQILGSAPGAINTAPTNINPTDVAGIYQKSYQDQLQAYNQSQSNMGNLISGVGSLALKAAPLLMASDKNLKEDRHEARGEDILSHISRMPVDDYRYKDGAQVALGLPEHRTGPMAQDWQSHFGGDGHTIDLGDMAGKMLAAIQALEARTAHIPAKR